MKIFGWEFGRTRPALPGLTVADLQLSQGAAPQHRWFDGEKFPGGFGPTQLLALDYWTLRARSAQLFRQNLYARGILRRLITNEINTGLHLEATPAEKTLGFDEDGLAVWAEDVETAFQLWADDRQSCDFLAQRTFGSLQAAARLEALADGDVLVVLLQSPTTQLPSVQLVNGAAVQTPVMGAPPTLAPGNRIANGVELDEHGRHVAYWIRKRGFEWSRLAAVDDRGRRVAWLMYGTDRRVGDVRGEPLLSLVLQSLMEIDRYRDSTQRKAVINSVLAMFIAKGEDKSGTRPLAGGAIRRGQETTTDDAGSRTYNFSEHIPGLVLDELAHGETPHGFQPHGTDEKFGTFEEAIIQAVAWANEIPPEILRLSFSSNYSASQAAINEFKMYLNRLRRDYAEQFTQPIYEDWLLSAVLVQKVEAIGLIEAWRDPLKRDLFIAWTSADWTGQIKPAVDMSRLVEGYKELVREGFVTRDRAARELTGTKFAHNAKKLRRENEQLVEANEPLAELERAAKAGATPDAQPVKPKKIDDEPIDDEDDEDAPSARHALRVVE